VIEARDLSKHYGGKRAVDHLSFTVPPGKVTGFLGPNGAGKSTTMRLLLGLDRADTGSATIDGKPYRDLAEPLRVVGALLEARAVHTGRSAYNHLLILAQTQGLPRRRVEEVIERAKECRIPLHMLGLGRAGELDEKVMRKMASATGGEFHHARNENDLIQIFEDLSIQLHDDGFDHAALEELAKATGGKFYHARQASQLQMFFQDLSEELQSTYTVTFASRRQLHDGTSRGIDISVMRDGARVSDVSSFDYQVPGVVVPKMDSTVYIGLLAVLGVLLALPVGMRRMFRGATSHT